MKNLNPFNRRRVIIVLFGLAVLNSLFFFFLRDVIREIFVLPLSYIFYLGGIFVDSTPQIFFWAAIIVLSVWITSRSLNRRRKVAEPGRQNIHVDDLAVHSTGRVNYWMIKLNILRRYHGGYLMGGFHQSLARLLVEMLAHRYHLTIPEVERRIRSGSLDLPTEVIDYIHMSLSRPGMPVSKFGRIWQKILTLFYRLFGKTTSEQESSAALTFRHIDKVIHYMEEELEISYEHHNE